MIIEGGDSMRKVLILLIICPILSHYVNSDASKNEVINSGVVQRGGGDLTVE